VPKSPPQAPTVYVPETAPPPSPQVPANGGPASPDAASGIAGCIAGIVLIILLIVMIAVSWSIISRAYCQYISWLQKKSVERVVKSHFIPVSVHSVRREVSLWDLLAQYDPEARKIIREDDSSVLSVSDSSFYPHIIAIQGEPTIFLATFTSLGGGVTFHVNVNSKTVKPADGAAVRLFAVQHMQFDR